MRQETSVAQRVYEFIVRADREVRTREIVAAVGAHSVSAVTFALTRLTREGNIERVGYARYRIVTAETEHDLTRQEAELDERLGRIFESVRPVLNFADLSFLYRVVLVARRVAPDMFRENNDAS